MWLCLVHLLWTHWRVRGPCSWLVEQPGVVGSAATGQLESRARSSCSCLLSQGIVRLVLASWGWWWVPDLLHLHSSMEFGLKLTCCNWAWVGMSSSTDRFKFPKWHLVGWCHHSRKSSSKWLLPNGYFQCSLSKGESQLPSPIQEALQDPQVGLTHASFKLVLVYWDLECVTFCMHG